MAQTKDPSLAIAEMDEPNAKYTKCWGRNCPRRKSCRRYVIKQAEYRQKWEEFDALHAKIKDACEGYDPI